MMHGENLVWSETKAINAYVNEHTKGRIYLVPAFWQ